MKPAGFSFLVSLFYVMRGVWVWRKRARCAEVLASCAACTALEEHAGLQNILSLSMATETRGIISLHC